MTQHRTNTQHPTCFNELPLCDNLLKALEKQGFVTPSPIQAQAIPHLLTGSDLVGLAQTGTGKTAAFALPILQHLHDSNTTQHAKRMPKALILTPTRELAIQIAAHIEQLCAYMPEITITVLCGGQDYRPQLKQLKAGASIVVGTPGRVLDHLERRSLILDELHTLVLDEADEMLRMGFIEDVETVLSKLSKDTQKALFSATMPPRIRQIAHRYLADPITVEIHSETATVKNIEQRFLIVPQEHKMPALLRILTVEAYQAVIVFVRTKGSTEEVAHFLQQQGIQAMAMHGDITQALRERIIQQFKQGSIDVLVATDVAARGLDVDRVTHVINFDMVTDSETYVHRIGRTGRAGRCGITILFATPREGRMVSQIERHTRQRITKIAIPNDDMIQQARQRAFLERITQRLEHSHLSDYRQVLQQYMLEKQLSAIDIAAALAVLAQQDKPLKQVLAPIPEFTTREKNQRKFMQDSDFDRPGYSKSKNPAKSDFAQQELFRIEIGRIHGVKPGNIVGALANEGRLQSRFITGLKILDDHSTVRLPCGIRKDIFQRLSKAWVCGRQLKLTSLGVV